MTRCRTWILVAAVILVPSVAQAQVWWDFIESLSGPGPFQGYRLLRTRRVRHSASRCPRRLGRSNGRTSASTIRDPNIRHVVEVRGLFPSTGEGRPAAARFTSRTRVRCAYSKWDGVASLRVLPSLDVGAGGGAIKFTGEDVNEQLASNNHPVQRDLHPAGTVNGATHRFGRIFRIHLETMYIPFGFTGADWGQPNLSPTRYSTDGNWVLAGGLLIDFGTLFDSNA